MQVLVVNLRALAADGGEQRPGVTLRMGAWAVTGCVVCGWVQGCGMVRGLRPGAWTVAGCRVAAGCVECDRVQGCGRVCGLRLGCVDCVSGCLVFNRKHKVQRTPS